MQPPWRVNTGAADWSVHPKARLARILVFIDLVQDIDVLLPLLLALREGGFSRVRVIVSRWLVRESPRTAGLLGAHGIDFSYVKRRDVIDGRAPSLRGVAAVFSAAESSHPAHAAAHALAIRAGAIGARTYVLQHGLENVGLIGHDSHGAVFASETVFCWFPPAARAVGTPARAASNAMVDGVVITRAISPRISALPSGLWRARPASARVIFENWAS